MDPEDLINRVLSGETPAAALFQKYREILTGQMERTLKSGMTAGLQHALKEISNSSSLAEANVKIWCFLMKHVFRDL